ncbi:50S ribosomal protein L15 [Halorientalis sp. IM1011]|uniref:uL15m family ribosomal protein n=1 Tax=Halorientalis sp. IM1011 TaxID=1932360 RepID=UPI00097CD5D1|nr:uL15m family ribosomal protein [Halorientalis sp. IM1011]AQL43564.1 50S ribosomal protein L15 [Halorientalis sp. IM1011]
MTSKKKRQRGSRTHGGGSHKNRRGAGHRGGRGRAGRDKHEFHNYEPLGKSGFKRPQKLKEEIAEIDLRELDEDAALLAADGVAEETDGGFRIDVRDVVEDGHEVDAVKVLGGGQVRNELTVLADDFSESARELLESAGGSAELTERGEKRQAEREDESDKDTSEEEGSA